MTTRSVGLLLQLARLLPRRVIKMVARQQWRSTWAKRWYNRLADRFRGKDAVIHRGVGAGLHFNTGPSHAGYVLGTSEPLMQAAFSHLIKPGMAVYDLGAHVGFFTVIASRLVGPEGDVISCEPLPDNVEMIEYNVRLNQFTNVRTFTTAIGDRDGEARFHVSAVPSWGRLEGTGQLDQKVDVISVPIARLDTIVRERSLPPPDVIKIDVEGAEADVLQGARGTATVHRPVLLIELHGTNDAVTELLQELSYRTCVLGADSVVTEAHWNAQIAAIPGERDALTPALEELARLNVER